MQVMAYTGKDFLVSATKDELMAILSALSKKTDDVRIGDKIPAYDYAAMIQACKAFKYSPVFVQFKNVADRLNKEAVETISSIETLDFSQ